jgi:hypothetical protein
MRARVWVISFAVWTVVGVFNITPTVVARLSDGQRFPRAFVALIAESVWVWALYTPVILWLCLRHPLARGWRTIAIHAACAVVVVFADPAVDTPFVHVFEKVPEPYRLRLVEDLFINVFSYAAVAGVGYALSYRRGLLEQRAHEAELQAQLLRARLDAVTARLQPHFLFNSLHSVTALIRADEKQAAIRAVVVLGDLLRATLAGDGGATVPLARELAWMRQYLEIEQMRFQDRLEVAIDVNDGLDDVLVPALVLQPLVENAIRHGVEARVGMTRIAVAARRETDSLVLEVVDSGDAAEPRAGNGVGLAATRERLAHMYGAAARLELAVTPDRSTATIAVPLQRGAA